MWIEGKRMKAFKLWETLIELKSDQYRWVDLSHTVSPETPHHQVFNALRKEHVLNFKDHKVASVEYTLVSQYGTHVDSPYHFHEDGRQLHEITIKEMVHPICVIDVTDKVRDNLDYGLTVDDLLAWEKEYGQIPAGCFMAMCTGWSKRSAAEFSGVDQNGVPHYPGWTIDALKFLHEERNVAVIGHEPSDTDPASTLKDAMWIGELYWLGLGKFQVELMVNLDQLPPVGAIVFCPVPKIEGGPGFTTRCFAIYPNE